MTFQPVNLKLIFVFFCFSRLQYSLRQLDLSLLSQLWSLNESIQDFRVILQEQDERSILSPPSPSPTPSSDEGEADEFYAPSPMLFRPAPPPPPDRRRPSNSSSGTGSSV
ncbi:PREDICTED: protein FAM89B-like [Nicrophorus vespilloides]|uniref:Protein FAM89B-like n=1 Tax=Nicrophorus vespilloides TaxID=110193 RepID=A0ABM1NJD6_NICVS|nr:PREDICTED: protein FAM89B-like [Nicrophorus vespilloides]